MNTPSHLAPYAVSEFNSRGRQHSIQLAKDRNSFQRDYTRLIHSSAFRKLQGKTQVFPAEQGDMMDRYRTRMSHSIEVEQISRSVARALDLNQDLAAAIAVGHDIGHAPFGHTGQDVLDELFKDHGGFEHNHHALRLVDWLESPYPQHRGLNLMFETREGLLKHCTRTRAQHLGDVAKRHINGSSPPLEVQVVDTCDQIAYLYGDLEDALDKNIFTPEFLMEEMPGFASFWEKTVEVLPDMKLPTASDLQHPEKRIQARAVMGEIWRRMLSDAVDQLIIQSRSNIELEEVSSLDDVRATHPLISFPDSKRELHRNLRNFSRKWIYDNPAVSAHRQTEKQALLELYDSVVASPVKWGLPKDPPVEDLRDFMASLTDRAVMSWYYQCHYTPSSSFISLGEP